MSRPINKNLTKDFLQNEYINNNKNSNQIGLENNYTGSYIAYLLRKYNIPTRNFKIKQKTIGKLVGGLLIVKRCGRNKRGRPLWECKCVYCNKRIKKETGDLRRRKTNGCKKCAQIGGFGHKNFKGYEEITGGYWTQIRKSAQKRNLKFDITIEYVWNLFLKQNRKCALTGIRLQFFARHSNEHNQGLMTASLDRIDSKKGYIEGNVQWVHKRINFMKHKLSDEEFINMCIMVAKYKGNI